MMNRRTVLTAAAAWPLLPSLAHAEPGDMSLPVTYAYETLSTAVNIEGHGPYPFLVATNQTFFQLSDVLAKKLKLKRQANPGYVGYTPEGPVKLNIYNVGDTILGGVMKMGTVQMIARDLGDDPTFFGTTPFFSRVPSTFDLVAGTVVLHRQSFTPPDGAVRVAMLPAPDGALSKTPVINAELDGLTLRLTVNTACNVAIEINPSSVARHGLWNRFDRVLRHIDPDGDESRTVRASRLKVAGQTFARPVIRLAGAGGGTPSSKMGSDGFIGLDLLRRFRVSFDPLKGEAWFKPYEALLNEPFSYNRAGFSIHGKDDEEPCYADNLLPGGPAEQAGMRAGDHVLWPKGDALANSYALTRPASSKATVKVERGGQVIPIEITLAELI